MGVEQSGNVTPGHLAVWVTNGVIADGGPVLSSQNVLASLLSADMDSIADQAIQIPSDITAFSITGILVTNSNVSLTVAAGGFYPETSKGGTAIVAASQVYSSLTSASKLLSCTLTGTVAATRYDRSNVPDWAIYLSLTTAQGAAANADVYLLGIDLTA